MVHAASSLLLYDNDQAPRASVVTLTTRAFGRAVAPALAGLEFGSFVAAQALVVSLKLPGYRGTDSYLPAGLPLRCGRSEAPGELSMAPQDSNLQTVRGLRQNQRPSKPQVLPAEPAIIEHEPFCARESNACCFDWLP